MIPKGSQRAGGQKLATHLLNEFDNDRVEVAQVRGAIAEDLHGAFAEWEATAKGTRCRKYLYSLSVNPDPEQGPLTRAQYRDFITRAEERLGLTGQPRALIFHVKHGREHCHAVWSRIDTQKMRAVQLSHDRQKLRSVVIDFARDHGLDLPRGVTRDRSKDDGKRRPSETWAEKQQQERTGETRDERMRAVTEAWRQSDDGRSLIRALEERGYLLARGNRRAYVVVDRFGEIHALARQIEGVRTRQVRERLANFPPEQLPDAARAQAFARERREALQEERVRGEIKARFNQAAEQRRQALADAHARRRARVAAKHEALKQQHRLERTTLRELQDARNRDAALKRQASRPKGLLAFLSRITGIQVMIDKRARRQDEQRRQEHRRQTEALRRRHEREMRDFSRHYRALDKVEAREQRSLRTALRRERLQKIGRGPRPPRPPAKGKTPPLRPSFEEAAGPRQPPNPIKPMFDEAAAPPKPPERDRSAGGISPDFTEAASGASDPEQPKREETPPAPAPDQDKEESLSETFERALKERAEQEKQRKEKERGRDQNGGRGPDRGP